MTAYTLSKRVRTAEEVRLARFDLVAHDEMERDHERLMAYLRTVDWHAVGRMIAGGRGRRDGGIEGRTAMPYRRKAHRWDGWVDEG